MAKSYETILLAAGASTRFKEDSDENKVLMTLGRQPVFNYSLSLFLNDDRCKKVWFVHRSEEKEHIKSHLNHLYEEVPEKIVWIKGGKERQDSVAAALQNIKSETAEAVLIHDAARPFVTKDLIDRLLDEIAHHKAVTLGIQAKDSIKVVKDGKVEHSLYRPHIWRIQTPQLFNARLLKQAMSKAKADGFYGNEEGELVERLGEPVRVVLGIEKNIKITTSFDFQIACFLMEQENH